MIENRSRIEKQILLGRQAVHKAYKSKARIQNSQDPRHMVAQKLISPSGSLPVPIKYTFSPSAQSGSDRPLSVDTDAEAAYARGSRFFKRRNTSKQASPSRITEDKEMRSSWRGMSASDQDREHGNDEVLSAPSSPKSIPSSPSASILSRLHGNSLSRLSLPFSIDHPFSPRPDSSSEHKHEHTWSSESSSEDDYPLD